MWGKGKAAGETPSVEPAEQSPRKDRAPPQPIHDDAKFGAPSHSRSGRPKAPVSKAGTPVATTVWWKLDDIGDEHAVADGSTTGTSPNATEERLPCLIFHPQSMFRVRSVWERDGVGEALVSCTASVRLGIRARSSETDVEWVGKRINPDVRDCRNLLRSDHHYRIHAGCLGSAGSGVSGLFCLRCAIPPVLLGYAVRG